MRFCLFIGELLGLDGTLIVSDSAENKIVRVNALTGAQNVLTVDGQLQYASGVIVVSEAQAVAISVDQIFSDSWESP